MLLCHWKWLFLWLRCCGQIWFTWLCRTHLLSHKPSCVVAMWYGLCFSSACNFLWAQSLITSHTEFTLHSFLCHLRTLLFHYVFVALTTVFLILYKMTFVKELCSLPAGLCLIHIVSVATDLLHAVSLSVVLKCHFSAVYHHDVFMNTIPLFWHYLSIASLFLFEFVCLCIIAHMLYKYIA